MPPSGTDLLLEALLPFLRLGHSGPQCFLGISHWASPPPGAVGWALSPSSETGARRLQLKTNRARALGEPPRATTTGPAAQVASLPRTAPCRPGAEEGAGRESPRWRPCASRCFRQEGVAFLPLSHRRVPLKELPLKAGASCWAGRQQGGPCKPRAIRAGGTLAEGREHS